VRVQLSAVAVFVDGKLEACETDLVSAGAYVIAVTTTLHRRGALLASSFLTDLAGHAAATHLWNFGQLRRLEHDLLQLTGSHLGRTCVLEHAATLQELLGQELADSEVCVDVGDQALAEAERIWGTSPSPP
jgi:hypothetical protein